MSLVLHADSILTREIKLAVCSVVYKLFSEWNTHARMLFHGTLFVLLH